MARVIYVSLDISKGKFDEQVKEQGFKRNILLLRKLFFIYKKTKDFVHDDSVFSISNSLEVQQDESGLNVHNVECDLELIKDISKRIPNIMAGWQVCVVEWAGIG